MNLESITALRKYISIASHKPGQISLKFGMQILSDPIAMDIIKQNKNTPMPKAIFDTKLNLLARTLTLNYDASIIDSTEFDEILTTRSRARFDELAKKYMTILTA